MASTQDTAVGQSIPSDTAHVSDPAQNSPQAKRCGPHTKEIWYCEQAVSVSLPTWKANVGYEEGEDWVLSKMQTGYPR